MDTILNSATEILLLLFLAITFVQSGLDKILDWKGNLSWLKRSFCKNSLQKYGRTIIGDSFNY